MNDNSRHVTFRDYTKEEAQDRALLALEAGRMASWDWDIEASQVTGDQLIAEILGVDYHAQPWPADVMDSAIHPDDVPAVRAALDQALSDGDVFEIDHRNNPGADVAPAWFRTRGRVSSRKPDGTALHLMGVTWDITEQKVAKEKLEMLSAEMDHRIKNSFSVIRGLINIASKDYGEVSTFASMLRAQVEAMGTAHMLTSEMARLNDDHTKPVPLASLIAAGLEAWMIDANHERIRLNISPEPAMSPKHAEAFTMLMYELATNANKHGALSMAEGSIDITITPDVDKTFRLEWQETCPTRIEPPRKTGFGTTLITLCCGTLSAQDVTKDLKDTGLHVSMRLPSYEYRGQ